MSNSVCFFTGIDKIKEQTSVVDAAFGYQSPGEYQICSVHSKDSNVTSSLPLPAYAVCEGYLFYKKIDEGANAKIIAILKPDVSLNKMPVRYFIYLDLKEDPDTFAAKTVSASASTLRRPAKTIFS